MPNVNLYQKFDFTDAAGNTYSDGSTTTAKTISVAGSVFDRTYSISDGVITELWADAAPYPTDFDFMWIESDVDAEIQLVCNEGGVYDGGSPGLENGFVIKLKAGIPFVLSADDSRNRANMAGAFSAANYTSEQNTWESDWSADLIDRIEFYRSGSAAVVRVFVVT